jgi:hypothetical protein
MGYDICHSCTATHGLRRGLYSFAASRRLPRLALSARRPFLLTHSLRPFGKLRAGSGLYSFAASRLFGQISG